MRAEELLRRLEGGKKTPKGYQARCPAHEDHNASLSISEGEKGLVLHCFAGCSLENVCAALGVKVPDLFYEPKTFERPQVQDFEIRTAAGELVAIRKRVGNGPKKVLWWELPSGKKGLGSGTNKILTADLPLYGSQHLPSFDRSRWVELCEGEPKTEELRALGAQALGTSTGASSGPSLKVLESLRGWRVRLWPDNDSPGRTHMKKNAARLEGIAAELCTLDTSSLPPAGDAVQWIEEQLFSGLTKTQLREALLGEELPGLPRQQANNTPSDTGADELQVAEPFSQPKARTLEEFMALQPKPRAGLCGFWLRAGALAMVSGDSGAGKTWFCLDLALSVSTGVPFMGRWSVPYARKVLVVSGEDDIEDLQERLSSLLTAKTKTVGRELSPLLSLLNANDLDLLPNGLPNLGTPEGRAKVEANLEGVSLVILDNYSVLFNGVDENDAREFAPVQDWFFWFKARGIAVLLVSHTGKNGDHRGSSKKLDGLNATILLNHPANWKASDGASFDLRFKKSRDARGAEVEAFSAKLGEDEQGDLCWLFDTAPPAILAGTKPAPKTTEILELHSKGKTAKEIIEAGYTKPMVYAVLSALKKSTPKV